MNSLSPERTAELLKSLKKEVTRAAPERIANISVEDLGGNITSPITKGVEDKSNHYSPGKTSSTEERALDLLGSGINSENVALALGVTPSYISQLLSNEDFSDKVAKRRYEHLQKHNIRDNSYDELEDLLLAKLKNAMPLMFKPDTILKAISTINGAKRRGQSSPDQVTNQNNIVNLILPAHIITQFSTNIENQVIRAGDQDLQTMQSNTLLEQVERRKERAIEHLPQEDKQPCQKQSKSLQQENEVLNQL